MLCCIAIVALLGPLGLWAMPRATLDGGPDCCANNRRKALVIGSIAISVAALGLACFFLISAGPSYFSHICSAWGGR